MGPLQDFLCSSGSVKRREHPQCDRAGVWQRWNTFVPEQTRHERWRLAGWKTTQLAGGNMKKYFAELVGTFILVLFGCGTAVVAGDKVGILGIAFAFGLALIGGGLRDRPHLRLPHQPGGQPGRVCGGTHVDQGHDRLLGRAVPGRRAGRMGALDHRQRRWRAATTLPPADLARTAGARAIRAATTSLRPSCLSLWPR